MFETKKCNNCLRTKSLSNFHVDNKNKTDGHQAKCKECRSAHNKEHRSEINAYKRDYYILNRDRELSRGKEWALANREKVLRIKKKSYQKNKHKAKEYRILNKDRIAIVSKKNRDLHKDDIATYNRQYRIDNKELIMLASKEYYKNNKESFSAKSKIWYKTNQDTIKIKSYEYYQENKKFILQRVKNNRGKINLRRRNRYNNDPTYRLLILIRTRINNYVRGKQKSCSSIALLGCDQEQFKKYFEQMFSDGMSWNNFMVGDIEVDHIIPLSIFDLSERIQQKVAFNWANTMPMWKTDNRSKHATVPLGFNLDKHIKEFSKLHGIQG